MTKSYKIEFANGVIDEGCESIESIEECLANEFEDIELGERVSRKQGLKHKSYTTKVSGVVNSGIEFQENKD
jgi:hypothetical protein